MNQLKWALLLLCLVGLTSCENNCIWNHVGFSTRDLLSCGKNITFELIPIEGQYVQIPYNVSNTELLTPYNLSIMNVTVNNVSTIYPSASFHIHHKSKHVVDWELYDLEVQLAHQIFDGQVKLTAGVGILFKAYPGDFPDPFDHWNLDTKVPILQNFPIKLKNPAKSYHYEGLPGCPTTVMFFLDDHVIKIKESSLKKVAKLVDATKPAQSKHTGASVHTNQVCVVTAKDKKWKAIHHLNSE